MHVLPVVADDPAAGSDTEGSDECACEWRRRALDAERALAHATGELADSRVEVSLAMLRADVAEERLQLVEQRLVAAEVREMRLARLISHARADFERRALESSAQPGEQSVCVREFPFGMESLACLLMPGGRQGTAAGLTALHKAAAQEHEEVVHFLCEAGLGERMADGTVPIFAAAQRGHTGVVRLLCEAGVDMATATGDSPLHAPASQGHLAVVEYLLSSGADADAKSQYRASAVEEASGGGSAGVIAAWPQRCLAAAGASCG